MAAISSIHRLTDQTCDCLIAGLGLEVLVPILLSLHVVMVNARWCPGLLSEGVLSIKRFLRIAALVISQALPYALATFA